VPPLWFCSLALAAAAALQPEMRTKILPGNGYIRYEVLPGDEEEPAGELIVVHVDRAPPPPAVEPTTASEPPPPRRRDLCAPERAKLVARLFEMRGMQVDPAFAEWLERNLTLGTRGVPTFQIGGEPILITAVKADAIARTLAEDLAHCEATSH